MKKTGKTTIETNGEVILASVTFEIVKNTVFEYGGQY
jgi:hypothetical protein